MDEKADISFADTILQQPLDEVKQDIFFRADNFKHKEWYNEFSIFTRIGICSPLPSHALEVQKALKVMGYSTRLDERNGKTYVCPCYDMDKNSEHAQKAPKKPKSLER